MDELKKTVIQRWLVKADHDLITARVMLENESVGDGHYLFPCPAVCVVNRDAHEILTYSNVHAEDPSALLSADRKKLRSRDFERE